MNWTKRYCDHEHLKNVKRGYQVTVVHWMEWSECMVLSGLKDIGRRVFEGEDHEMAARQWGERQAIALHLFSDD